MVQALGARLLDKNGDDIGFGGAQLEHLVAIDVSGLDARIAQCKFEVACDVTNPLTGKEGASAIFGPQKGVTPQMVAQLDRCLLHYAQVIAQDMAIEVGGVPGAGVAGGIGAALLAFCHADLRQGIEIVTEALGLDAVFSVLYSICTLEEALENAADNVRMTARNIAATIRLSQQI